MPRRILAVGHRAPTAGAVLALVATMLLATLVAGPASAQEPPPDPNSPIVTVAPVPPPAASIVVDVGTGEVISASDARTPMLPASTTKILTALLVRQHLDLDQEIVISPTATLAEARRLGLEAGSRWVVRDLLYAALLCSCNDAAWALGEAAGGGSMAGFAQRMSVLMDTLGLADDPIVRDPAGFDDHRSIGGGNLLSARDLAIAARAFLADPELAAIARTPRYDWVGGDGEAHYVINQNRFLEAYPGAIGLKTGATDAAGQTFVAAAERDGRTLVAVVLRTDAKYAEAAALLDAGFLLAGAGEVTPDVLPAVPAGLAGAPATTTTVAPTTQAPTSAPTSVASGGDQEVAAGPPVVSTGVEGDSGPVPVSWMAGGGAVVLAGGGVAAVAARRSSRAQTIDRRPARPRLRDRRRARPRRGVAT